jgi:hypothetical protein
MGLKKTKKLGLKKETLRRLGALTAEQLRAVAGGALLAIDLNKVVIETTNCLNLDSFACAGILTGGGVKTVSCDTHCQTSAGCYY